MSYSFAIKPLSFVPFGDEAEQLEKCKEWGLLSDKAAKVKTFYYKGNGLNEACEIVGCADDMIAVIRLAGERLHCIHPSYLKEMQASSFGQKFAARTEPDAQAAAEAENADAAVGAENADATVEAENMDATVEAENVETPAEAVATVETEAADGRDAMAAEDQPSSPLASPEPPSASPAATAGEKPKAKGGKGKAAKAQLPEEKVRLTATVKEFATVPNHFSDTDDEVIVYEAVAVLDPELELGEAWSSHSATLKKLELSVGDKISFEAKVVAKKLTKHPVPYKINNPSKLQKQDA